MKNIIALLFILSYFSAQLIGQNLSKQNLIDDLSYLNTAVVNGHPINYDPSITIDILRVVALAKQIESDQLTPLEYSLWIEKGIYQIGCSHTNISKNPLSTPKNLKTYIPLQAAIDGKELLITACLDTSQIGNYIESINGISALEFIEAHQEYKGSDGGTDAFAKTYFHFASTRIIAEFLQFPDAFKIKTNDGNFELSASKKVFDPDEINNLPNPILSNNKNKFYRYKGVAILKLTKFYKKDIKFYKAVFKQLNTQITDTLIIDLRHNTGGSRKAASVLTKYLVDNQFSYSLLQPKRLKTYKYLNVKGKYFFSLAAVKYNIFNFYRYRKNELGAEFLYKFKPKKQNSYKGKIYVLTDGFTGSASTMVTTWLKQYTDTYFIGSQASGGYNGNNGGTFPIITLPNSKIVIRFPGYRLISDKNSTERSGIIPDLIINPRSDYDKIVELLKER